MSIKSDYIRGFRYWTAFIIFTKDFGSNAFIDSGQKWVIILKKETLEWATQDLEQTPRQKNKKQANQKEWNKKKQKNKTN